MATTKDMKSYERELHTLAERLAESQVELECVRKENRVLEATLKNDALHHITQRPFSQKECSHEELNEPNEDSVVFMDVRNQENTFGTPDDRSQDLTTALIQCQQRCDVLEEERVIWEAKQMSLLRERDTDEIIISSLKEQLRVKKSIVVDLELQLKEEKEKFLNSFTDMKRIRSENEKLTGSLAQANQELTRTKAILAQSQHDYTSEKVLVAEKQNRIHEEYEQATEALKVLQQGHEELVQKANGLEERLETTLSENSFLKNENKSFKKSLKGLKDRMKAFTNSFQTENDPQDPQQEDHDIVDNCPPSAIVIDAKLDSKPSSSSPPLSRNASTSDSYNSERSEGARVMEKHDIEQLTVTAKPKNTVFTNFIERPPVSDASTTALHKTPLLYSNKPKELEKRELGAIAFQKEDAAVANKSVQIVSKNDPGGGSTSPDIFDAFDLAQNQMKTMRVRLKQVESSLKLSESMVLREVATREAVQNQLLQIRFDKAKAFQDLENLKVGDLFVIVLALNTCTKLKLLSYETERTNMKTERKKLEEENDALKKTSEATTSEIKQLNEEVNALRPLRYRSEATEKRNHELEKELVNIQLDLERAITTAESSKIALKEECTRFQQLVSVQNDSKIDLEKKASLQNELIEIRSANERLQESLLVKETHMERLVTDFNQCSHRLMTAIVLLNGLGISTEGATNNASYLHQPPLGLHSFNGSTNGDSGKVLRRKKDVWNMLKLNMLSRQCRLLRNTLSEFQSQQKQRHSTLQHIVNCSRNELKNQWTVFSSILKQLFTNSSNAIIHSKNELQGIHLELGELRTSIYGLKTDLRHYRRKEKALRHAPVLTTRDIVSSIDPKAELVLLPGHPMTSEHPMTASAVVETIVRVYYRRVQWMKDHPYNDDSIFDAILFHYTSNKREFHGVMPLNCTSINSPVSRLILNALNHTHLFKVQVFTFLLGLDESGLNSSSNTWQFFLKLLLCVFELLGENLSTILRNWSMVEGVSLPLQCIMDVVANLYNTDNPAGLDISKKHVSVLIKDSPVGPAVDFDTFLFLMLHQFQKGECPVDPLRSPRRCTDGSLPNLLNFHPGFIDAQERVTENSSNASYNKKGKIDIFKTIRVLQNTSSASRTGDKFQMEGVQENNEL
eukprot:g7157.t1